MKYGRKIAGDGKFSDVEVGDYVYDVRWSETVGAYNSVSIQMRVEAFRVDSLTSTGMWVLDYRKSRKGGKGLRWVSFGTNKYGVDPDDAMTCFNQRKERELGYAARRYRKVKRQLRAAAVLSEGGMDESTGYVDFDLTDVRTHLRGFRLYCQGVVDPMDER